MGTPPVIRSTVPVRNNYADYGQDLRWDFWFACAYCTMTEVEAKGIGFQIDHFVPVSLDPMLEHDYNNLMYSCQICNRWKLNLWPTEDMAKDGIRFVRPDKDDPDDHYELNDVYLVAKTSAGEFTRKCLNLDSLRLRKLRKIRAEHTDSNKQILFGILALSKCPFDMLPSHLKAQFLRKLHEIKQYASQIQKHVDFRLLGRSKLLDPDPDRAKAASERRKYLEKHGAIVHKAKKKTAAEQR